VQFDNDRLISDATFVVKHTFLHLDEFDAHVPAHWDVVHAQRPRAVTDPVEAFGDRGVADEEVLVAAEPECHRRPQHASTWTASRLDQNRIQNIILELDEEDDDCAGCEDLESCSTQVSDAEDTADESEIAAQSNSSDDDTSIAGRRVLQSSGVNLSVKRTFLHFDDSLDSSPKSGSRDRAFTDPAGAFLKEDRDRGLCVKQDPQPSQVQCQRKDRHAATWTTGLAAKLGHIVQDLDLPDDSSDEASDDEDDAPSTARVVDPAAGPPGTWLMPNHRQNQAVAVQGNRPVVIHPVVTVAQNHITTFTAPRKQDLEIAKSSGRLAKNTRPCIGSTPLQERTTVVIRDIPHNYSRDMVCALMDSRGFAGRYDFVYLPTDFCSWLAFGYAFVNMLTPQDALNIMSDLDGFSAWLEPSPKVCNVVWSEPYQGLQQNIERYRDSPVMNPCVDDKYKPALYLRGVRTEFPKPTKQLRAPRVRRSSQYSHLRAELQRSAELAKIHSNLR